MLHSYERCDENVVVYSSRSQIYIFYFPNKFFCDGIVTQTCEQCFDPLIQTYDKQLQTWSLVF